MKWNHIEIGKKQLKVSIDLTIFEKQLTNNNVNFTSKEIGNSVHVRSLDQGFEVQYQKRGEITRLNTFFAYFEAKKFKTFEGRLPFGINKNWTLKSTIVFLGQPQIKSKHIVQTIYENLGLGIVFQGHWANEQSRIEYCYFFQPEKGTANCAQCTKPDIPESQNEVLYSCKECHFVKYCSQYCLSKHFGLHKIFCQFIQES